MYRRKNDELFRRYLNDISEQPSDIIDLNSSYNPLKKKNLRKLGPQIEL